MGNLSLGIFLVIPERNVYRSTEFAHKDTVHMIVEGSGITLDPEAEKLFHEFGGIEEHQPIQAEDAPLNSG